MAPPIFLPVTGLASAKQIVGNVLTVKKELKEARDAAQNTSSGFDDIASKIGYPEDIEEDTKQFKKLRRDMEDLLNERDNLRDRLDQSIEACGEVADLNSDELVKRAIKLPDKVTAMLLRVNQAVFSNMDNILELHEDYRHLLSADDQHIESQRNVDPGAESQLADTNNVQRLKAALELSSIETEELKEQLHDMEKEMDNVTRDLRTKCNTAQSESAALRKQVKTFQAIKDDRSKLHQRLAKADAEVLEMKEDLKVANALSESCVQERQSMKDSLDAANVTIVNKTAMITELEASIASLEMTGEKDEKTSNEIIQKLHGRLDVLAAESNKNYWDMRNQLTDENLGLLSEKSRLENEIKNLKDTNGIQDLQARLERDKALGLEEEVGQLTTTIEHMRKKLDDSRRGLREAQESVRHLQSDVHDIEYDRDCYAQKLVAANRSKERLEEKLQAALARLTEQSTDMMDVTAFNTMHNQLQGLRDKVEELTIARDSSADSNGMLKRTNEQMEKAITHLTASERLRSIENGVLAQELEETRQKLLDAENRLAAPTHEVSQLRFELERKKIELGATKQISDQRKAERDDFQKSWMEALEASNQQQAEASKASIDVQRLQQELTQAKDRLQDYDSRMAVVSAKNHSLQTNLSKLQDEKKTVESHVTKLEGSCQSLQQTIDSVNSNLNAKTQALEVELRRHDVTTRALSRKVEDVNALERELKEKEQELAESSRSADALNRTLGYERNLLQDSQKALSEAEELRRTAIKILTHALALRCRSPASPESFQGLVEMLLRQIPASPSNVDTSSTPWVILNSWWKDESDAILTTEQSLEANIVDLFGAITVDATLSPSFLVTVAQVTKALHRRDTCPELSLDVFDNMMLQFADHLHETSAAQPLVALSIWQIMSIVEERWQHSNHGWFAAKQKLEKYLASVHFHGLVNAMRHGVDEAFKHIHGCRFLLPHIGMFTHTSWTAVIVLNLEEHTLRAVDRTRIVLQSTNTILIKATNGEEPITLPVLDEQNFLWLVDISAAS